jgi:hypothetical protein
MVCWIIMSVGDTLQMYSPNGTIVVCIEHTIHVMPTHHAVVCTLCINSLVGIPKDSHGGELR